MSKYIRTAQGIFEYKSNMIIENAVYYYFGKFEKTDIKHLFRNDKDLGEVVKQADTIKDLCDVFKNVNIYAGTISFTDYVNFELARFNKSEEATLYGYIYIILPNGAVRIEPVAKMNEKGELELL